MATTAGSAIAPTSNVALVHTLMDQLTQREPGMPGIGTLYGPSGYGKTVAAAYASHPAGHNGIYLSCRSYDTKKSFVEQICKSAGIQAKGPIAHVVDDIVSLLAVTGRPLVIDEVDHIVESRILELVRDIHDAGVLAETAGITRRVVTSLQSIKRWCDAQGLSAAPADCAATLYTGAVPGRRAG